MQEHLENKGTINSKGKVQDDNRIGRNYESQKTMKQSNVLGRRVKTAHLEFYIHTNKFQ